MKSRDTGRHISTNRFDLCFGAADVLGIVHSCMAIHGHQQSTRGKERGKSWLSGPSKGLAGHDRVFGLGTDTRKNASGGKWGYIGQQPKGGIQILV
jgi:hypothetical protein